MSRHKPRRFDPSNPPEFVVGWEFGQLRGMTTTAAHKHLRKRWMPPPFTDKPEPTWNLWEIEQAENRHARVMRWLQNGGPKI